MIKNITYFTLVLTFIFNCLNLNAQEKNSRFSLGFNYGIGKQGDFPFSQDDDYFYEQQYFKVQLNYILKEKNKFCLQLNIEPAVFKADHQLLNKHFVEPSFGENYLEKREEYTQLKTINDYVLGIGLITRYQILKPMSIYAQGSIGPMITDTETERMAKGFAFSDVLSFGLSYKIKTIILDLRYGVRHVSNAELQQPNSGYNSTNFEFGFLVEL
ncbi:acyloxyacyl hydrolase [Urechidicola croceus]|nr:acyloxyacyl hydrolase [Urechidicola croceus]